MTHMEQRMDLLTLGVPDVAAARRFYVDKLGWKVTFEVPDDIVFLQANHGLLIALWDAAALAADATDRGDGSPEAPPISLAQVVATEDAVRAACDAAVAAGATLLKEPQHADFGGFHCYVADPSGFRWEIATNPGWHADDQGQVTLGPI